MRRSLTLTFVAAMTVACTPSTAKDDAKVAEVSAPASSAAMIASGASDAGAGVVLHGDGTLHLEPRVESMQNAGTVGKGDEACPVYLYAWDATKKGCTLSVTHCKNEAGARACSTAADERTLACGGTDEICGARVACDCPKGAPRAVDDAQGTVTLVSGAAGAAWTSADKRCRAHATTMNGPSPPPCIVALHECADGETCPERTVMLSCGIRDEICGKPIHCVCDQ